ncbi:MAG: acyl-CoA dehydrogenase family protein [Sphingomonas paucimobilis]
MDLSYTPEEEAFRADVRAFLAEKLPADILAVGEDDNALTKEQVERWQAILASRGWLAGHWPREHGGQDWTPVQRFLFEEEMARAGAPMPLPFGLNMLAPVLIKFGSPHQQQHWLGRMLRGEDWWCQGYSEPGAGSDLAALRTTARRDGDHYVVNGQKTWTTKAQYANMMFVLVRTASDGPRQNGISFLLVDMNSPGVKVRPILLLDGTHEVNEVFFDDVRVPVDNLVGEENRGWTYAKYLLTYERTSMAGIGASEAALARLRHLAAAERRDGRPLADDPLFAARLARLEIDLANLSMTAARVVADAAAGGAPGPESSILKIRGTELRQRISALARRAIGLRALPTALPPGPANAPDEAEGVTTTYLNLRKLTIYGGSNEVQKNIIGKTLLDL